MRPNNIFSPRQLITSLTELERCLSRIGSAQALHALTDVLLIPPDIPRLPIVLTAACNAIEAYGATLRAPNGMFRFVQSIVEDLRGDVTAKLGWTMSDRELAQPLLRRLLTHSPYALCLSIALLPPDQASRYWVALGVEIASCLATGNTFGSSFANDLRREITPQLFGGNPANVPAKWEKSLIRKIRLAAKLFETDDSPNPSETTHHLNLFDLKAGFELTRKLRYSAPRQRQALIDRHHQSKWQVSASASQLRARAESGDQTALLTMIAFEAGLSLATTREMPLGSTLAGNESVMVLNLDDGTLLTNLGRLTPAAAKPLPNSKIFREASWIAVKPLPAILVDLLRQLAEGRPGLLSLAELLPEASISGGQLTLAADSSTLKATTTRFLTSAGPVAVGLGIDRLSAALLTNDFAIIPGSKLYYALTSRTRIWDAAARLFSALDWGPAAPLVAGLPVGSHIIPKREAIIKWLEWMANEIKRHSPGRHCGIDLLVRHHNTYARYCASIAIWLLAAREAGELKFTTDNLDPTASFASLVDKWVGIIPGELWIPVCSLLQGQLGLWLAHCSALERRLKKLGLPPEHSLMKMMDRFNGGEAVPMFFEIEVKTFSPRALGSADLTSWWPESYRFSPDFGRHFWESELREADVRSSRIDLLMQHITQAVEGHCSTNADVLMHVAEEITAVQNELLHRLGFQLIPGLTSRNKG